MSSDSTAPMGRGRGRARARGHRSTSPRPIGNPNRGSNSPEEHLAMIDRPVRPGSQSPPTPYPGVSGRMEGMTLDPSRDTTTSGQSTSRGSYRGLRQINLAPGEERIEPVDDPAKYQDFRVRSRAAELTSKQGTKGDPMKMITNYFRLKRAPMWTLYEYHMEVEPQIDQTILRKALLRHNQDKSGLSSYIFDGTKIYTSTKLEPSPRFQFNAKLEFHGNPANREEVTETKHYRVTLVFHHTVEPGDPTYMHFYRVILRSCLFGMKLEEMGRNFYDAEAAIALPQHKLALWPGYVTSLSQHEQDVLLCVETTHKVLRTDSVLSVIKTSRGSQEAIQAQLRDTIVMTTYNRKTYRITDVDFKTTPVSTFETKKGGPTTYMDYYKAKHGMQITDRGQPMLVAKLSKKDLHRGEDENKTINLIPEFCQLTGLTDAMRENFSLMKELSKYLHVGPQERVKEINHFMNRLSEVKDLTTSLQKWGLEFERKLSSVAGRALPCEKMIFADNAEQTADNKGDWTIAFRSKKMLTTVNLSKWVVIVPQRDAGGVDNLTRTMAKVAAPLNMRIANPTEIFKVTGLQGPDYVRAINGMVEKYPDLQMLFIILPTNKPEPYGAVKKRLAVDFGIPSQCFVAKNVMSKGLMSIATKVVVQMNAKLGGEPWTLKLPLKKMMVVGYDVYHGAKGTKGGRSIGAMVSTVSSTFARYFSTTSDFSRSDANEFSRVMQGDFTKCFQAYQEENGELPDRIFLFRDGVGDGQLAAVYHTELAQLQQSMKDVYEKNGLAMPKFTFIVVTKKINSRIMLDRGGKYENPPPGTIVDDVITIPERYDFFLVSCAARQGTVSPCNYNVLYDSQGLDVDKIQMITYKMCHMYFNWSGTVAVPAPCQYAHKLAFITGMSYQGSAHGKLSKLLHFL